MEKKFTIDMNVYQESLILEAIEDFSQAAEIYFEAGELKIFGESDKEIQSFFHEFMNYVLSL